MKVIGIVSSPKKNSNTAVLVDEVLKGAKSNGAEVEMINLQDYKVEFCVGCFKCLNTGRCPIKDDFEMIKAKVKQADGIVLGSPTYMGTYNAELKKLLERFGLYEHMTSECLSNKYYIGVSAGGGGTGTTVKDLTSVQGLFGRGYVTGTMELPVKALTSKDYPDELTKCRQLGTKMVDDYNNNNTYPMQNIIAGIIKKYVVQPKVKRIVAERKDNGYMAVYDYLKKVGHIS